METAELVDAMERVRVRNNTLWMDIIRLALEVAPERTKAILRDIQANDTAVAVLLRDIGES
jgi:hypothetical protein